MIALATDPLTWNNVEELEQGDSRHQGLHLLAQDGSTGPERAVHLRQKI